MIDSLASLYTGPFAGLENQLVSAEAAPANVTRAADLFTPVGLDAALGRFAVHYPGGDTRAVTSLWSRYYLAAAVYVPLAANLVLERELPLGLGELGVALGNHAEPAQLVLAHDGEPVRNRAEPARFDFLVEDNLAPAIAVMAAHSGLSPRVLWSNAGHYFYYLAATLEATPGWSANASEAFRFMRRRHLPDGRRNPLFEPVRQTRDSAGECRMLRRMCCIQFRLERLGYCDNCPLL